MQSGNDDTPDTSNMKSPRMWLMRRFRFRCCLLLGIPLLLLVLLKVRTGPNKVVPVTTPRGPLEEPRGSRLLGLEEHRGHWEVHPHGGVRIVKPGTPLDIKKPAMRVRPGEQMLRDDVIPDAFVPPVIVPTTTPSVPYHQRSWFDQGRPVEKADRAQEGKGPAPVNDVNRQGGYGQQQLHREQKTFTKNIINGVDPGSNVKLDKNIDVNARYGDLNGKGNERGIAREGQEEERGRGVRWGEQSEGGGRREGREGQRGFGEGQEGKNRGVGLGTGGVRGKAREGKEGGPHGGKTEGTNKKTLEQGDGLGIKQEPNNADNNRNLGDQLEIPVNDKPRETVELSLDDIRAARGMRTQPPWMRISKPLQYEDYSKNCTQGSLPIPGASFHTKKFCLVDDTREHFGNVFKKICYHKGTDIERTWRSKDYCECKLGWHGKYCSMPDVVYKGGYPYEYGVGRQTRPRRLIYAFPFNGEFDMLEITLRTLSEAVDVFLILESNYTAAGQPKSRVLLEQFKQGYLKEFQHKVVYISLDYFPRVAYTNGWAADALLRNHIGQVAFDSILENVRDDDIVVSLDADEIVQPETLMFLRLHYGYPEPFGFTLQHSVYGYFWLGVDEFTNAYGGCRVSVFRDLLDGHLYDVRNAPKNVGHDARRLDKFKRKTGTRFKPWLFGSKDLPAGWHCSWCFLPEGIRYKLQSAHASDFPRWGTFPDKTELGFITRLVQQGLWFDEKTLLKRQQPYYAPPYVRHHADRFAHLVNHTAYMAYSQRYLTNNNNNNNMKNENMRNNNNNSGLEIKH